ncbi:hypothetical protein [Anaerotignum faecicola]|jgi:hypothetical protein|nr:hypothetical protein [Anaerotignum faecicola]
MGIKIPPLAYNIRQWGNPFLYVFVNYSFLIKVATNPITVATAVSNAPVLLAVF